MNYLNLIKDYRRILLGGFLLTFFSGFGQSFFISNYSSLFIETLEISQIYFGSIYSLMTMLSGFSLIWFGSLLDRVDSVKYTFFAILGFAFSCFLLSQFQSILVFAIAIFGVRFCGQGLFSHISSTIMARGFMSLRGRALSLTNMGHPFSEATLPLLAVYLTVNYGWQTSWLIYGLFMGAILLISVPFLLKGKVEVKVSNTPLKSEKEVLKFFARLPYFIKDYRFWYLCLGMIIPGSTLTGLFLYHSVLAMDRGWTMTWIASNFIWFAASQVISSLVGGVLVDKFGSIKMFMFYLVPLSLAYLILSLAGDSIWVVPCYLFMCGVTIGLGSPIKTAVWAEVYGINQIATLRSWSGAVGITGTALSPPILGYILDSGYGFSIFLNSAVALSALYIVGFSFVRKRLS